MFLFFLAACSVENDKDIGTILFSSSHDCDIRIFDSAGRQTARISYELGKVPELVYVKRSGVYIVHAVSGNLEYKEPLTFVNRNIEYYIEF